MPRSPRAELVHGSLVGRRVVTTRDTPGELDRLLTDLGAEVVHLPLIEIGEASDGGAELVEALERLDRYDWVVVTSRHGATRVAGAVAAAPRVRTAAVGTATASVLEAATGRPVDLVPDVQRATGLVEAFERLGTGDTWSVLVAQADRAEPTLVDGLAALGHRVDVRCAYTTKRRVPSDEEREAALEADAVAFASGSAAQAWIESMGTSTPPVVCAIGPTTARVAGAGGLRVTHMADTHSVHGLARCVVDALAGPP